MNTKRILMIIGDFVEDYEVMVPFQILLVHGHAIDVVCPGKKAGESVATAIHDFEGEQTYSEKRGHNFQLNATFDEIDPREYDGLLLPGGRAEYLRLNPRVLEITKSFSRDRKPIGAICHGSQILAAAGLLASRSITSYPGVRPEIEACGGRWVEASPTLDNAHVDGNLVSTPAWPGQAALMKAFLEMLGSATSDHHAAKSAKAISSKRKTLARARR